MSADIFEETRMADLDRAMREYTAAKQNYQRMVRMALEEKDPAKRSEYLGAIRTENQRLVRVVEGLMAAWSEGNLQHSEKAQQKVIDLEQELQNFQKQLDSIQTKQDTIVQLQSVLTTLTSDNSTARTTYYGYIIAVLVLLVVVFIMFVYSYMSSAVSAITTSVTNALPTVE